MIPITRLAILLAAGALLVLIFSRVMPAPAQAQAEPTAAPVAYLPVVLNAPPLPTATPAPGIYVENQNLVQRDDDPYVLGEVVNRTTKPIYQPKIVVKFFNASGAFVATADNVTTILQIDPGRRAPFYVGLSNPPAGITRYEIAVEPSSFAFPSLDLRVLSANERDNDGPEVFGDVLNEQSKRLTGGRVVVTFYDAAGKVVGTDYTFLDALTPGQSVTYRVSTYESDLVFATYTVQAQGRAP